MPTKPSISDQRHVRVTLSPVFHRVLTQEAERHQVSLSLLLRDIVQTHVLESLTGKRWQDNYKLEDLITDLVESYLADNYGEDWADLLPVTQPATTTPA